MEPALPVEPPEDFIALTKDVATSYQHVKLLWNGLKPDTRKNYAVAIRSYTAHCRLQGYTAWPATTASLSSWLAARAFGSSQPLMGQVTANTLQSYLSALRSVHVDLGYPTDTFSSEHLDRIIQGARNIFPKREKRKRLPITRDILTDILSPAASRGEDPIDTANLNAAFALAFAGFLRIGEITYTPAQARQRTRLFAERVTRRCVTLDAQGQSMTLLLPRSKTDRNNDGVRIIVARAPDTACPITLFQRLAEIDPQPPDAPLFRLSSGAFNRSHVLRLLQRRLANVGRDAQGFSGHSFRKGAAQQAYDNHLHEDQIQLLGRWTSEAFRRYYKSDPQRLFHTHLQFLTGRAPSYS